MELVTSLKLLSGSVTGSTAIGRLVGSIASSPSWYLIQAAAYEILTAAKCFATATPRQLPATGRRVAPCTAGDQRPARRRFRAQEALCRLVSSVAEIRSCASTRTVGMVSNRDLAPGEWAVLALLCERPAHGWALARQLSETGELGSIWSLKRPLVYRGLEILEARGLIVASGHEPGARGPNRTIFRATPAGPVGHLGMAARAGRARSRRAIDAAAEARVRPAELRRPAADAARPAGGADRGDRVARGACARERGHRRDPASLPPRVLPRVERFIDGVLAELEPVARTG